MAILTGINTHLRGSAGDWTFSRQGGKTVAKQKIEAKATPTRSYAQMKRRVKWGNLVNVYRSFEGNLHPSFESRKAGVSDFNEFVSSNIDGTAVYLTKDVARQGGAVVAEYIITRGTLPSIEISVSGNTASTDISLGGLSAVDATTTVANFSAAIVQNNTGYEYGDQLTFFLARQEVNSTTGVPYVRVESSEVTLSTSTELLGSVAQLTGFGVNGGMLGMSTQADGAVAWVHSRRSGGKTKVSTQLMRLVGSTPTDYSTEAALSAAILSYGGTNKEDYLTPNPTEDLAAAEEGGEDQNP